MILKKERQRRKAGEAAPELMQEGAKVLREIFSGTADKKGLKNRSRLRQKGAMDTVYARGRSKVFRELFFSGTAG